MWFGGSGCAPSVVLMFAATRVTPLQIETMKHRLVIDGDAVGLAPRA